MTFSADTLLHALDSSYQQGGAEDFKEFIGRHLWAQRWIIAADFNISSPDSAHDVYAFACFPIEREGWDMLRTSLATAFPTDFKDTRAISRAHKSFFERDMCYCFVVLAPKRRISYADKSHHENLVDARNMLADAIASATASGRIPPFHLAALKRLEQEAKRKTFSLNLLDRILILSILFAFISKNIAMPTSAEHLGWFPDRDKMTTFAKSAWDGLAHLNFSQAWHLTRTNRPAPHVGIIDHRITNHNHIYDLLIRVPDFLAAVLSRWNLEGNRLIMPEGTKRAGGRRYRQLVKRWTPENKNLWIGRIFMDGDALRCARVVAARSRRRLERHVGASAWKNRRREN